MDQCMYCSAEFPDSTYLSDRGVCGAGPCREAYKEEWGLVDAILETLEERQRIALEHGCTPDIQRSRFINLAYYPKEGEIEKREAIKEILETAESLKEKIK